MAERTARAKSPSHRHPGSSMRAAATARAPSPKRSNQAGRKVTEVASCTCPARSQSSVSSPCWANTATLPSARTRPPEATGDIAKLSLESAHTLRPSQPSSWKGRSRFTLRRCEVIAQQPSMR